VGPSLLQSTAALPEQVEANFRENIVTVTAPATNLLEASFW
jgi:hypothetical protein